MPLPGQSKIQLETRRFALLTWRRSFDTPQLPWTAIKKPIALRARLRRN